MSYRDKLYDVYVQNSLGPKNVLSEADWEGYYRFFRRNYGDILPEDRDARILDAGCGTGQFLYFLERAGYTNYVGIDGSPDCVEFCRNSGRSVEEANLLDYLPEHPDTFDFIVLNDVIEHLKKDEGFAALEHCVQALKPGSTAAIKTDNMGCPMFAPRSRYGDLTHEVGFTEPSLEAAMSAAGFTNVRVLPVDPHTSPYAPINVLARLAQKTLHMIFRGIFRLYGVRTHAVMTLSILGVGSRPAE